MGLGIGTRWASRAAACGRALPHSALEVGVLWRAEAGGPWRSGADAGESRIVGGGA